MDRPGVHPRACGEAWIRLIRPRVGGGPSPRVRGSRRGSLFRRGTRGSIPARAGKPASSSTRPSPPGVHPRACGEAAQGDRQHAREPGPSPRVRGSLLRRRNDDHGIGSIPARAGKPPSEPLPSPRRSVHPRACGEAKFVKILSFVNDGPSPRVRGSRRVIGRCRHRRGSIPARAGKPAVRGCGCRPGRVHPRACGEADLHHRLRNRVGGPSPRVRGSLVSLTSWSPSTGSIPARAGKPPRSTWSGMGPEVHPRACGEARDEGVFRAAVAGPSPRVRGSPGRHGGAAHGGGSIPARAGKPWTGMGPPHRPQVHPRACGEALLGCRPYAAAVGPSPRVRGSHRRRQGRHLVRRSIPARAGKPPCRRPRRGATGVHPRACGEAASGVDKGLIERGPSPRVRGSRRDDRRGHRDRGSIPARAGKPERSAATSRPGRVHPRACGEAGPPSGGACTCAGPSPRVRGSPVDAAGLARCLGSIPARAGKPLWRRPASWSMRVHPRACGEAVSPCIGSTISSGPSPRVRGSHRRPRGRKRIEGSIPARAGKPRRGPDRQRSNWVHPRACGEAGSSCSPSVCARGPSPRVRGSLAPGHRRRSSRGSIPARAGKPIYASIHPSLPWVHPRACGEAARMRPTWFMWAGPSPRVRGSRQRLRRQLDQGGSIPARAGKPGIALLSVVQVAVHPRACGEA